MLDPRTPEGRAEIRRCGAALPGRLLDLVETREDELSEAGGQLAAAQEARQQAEAARLRAALEAAEDFLTTLWNERMVDNNPPAVAEGEPERMVPVEQVLGIIRAALEPAPEGE